MRRIRLWLKFERYIWFHGQVKRWRYPNAISLVDELEFLGKRMLNDIILKGRVNNCFKFLDKYANYLEACQS